MSDTRTELENDPQFSIHDISLLFQLWSLADPYVGAIDKESPATRGSLQKLTKLELIVLDTSDSTYLVTGRGEAYIKHLGHIPVPYSQWGYDK